MSRSQATPRFDLRELYLQLAQSLRQKRSALTLPRLELLTRHTLLLLVLARALKQAPGPVRERALYYYQRCLAPVVGADLSMLVSLQEDCFLATAAREVDNIFASTLIPLDLPARLYEQCLTYALSEQQQLVLRVDQGTRQQEGSYYTPLPLVCFVLERTVEREIEACKSEVIAYLRAQRYVEAQHAIARLETLKVLDISCGGGVFLLHACMLLGQAYTWWNEQVTEWMRNRRTNEQREVELRAVSRPLTSILQRNIFGIDRDPEAVAITRVSLVLLQIQEEGVVEDALCECLNTHIVVADALLAPPDISALCGDTPHTRIIVGNPPWGANLVDTAYSQHYASARGQYDSYELFIEQATRWLRNGDMLGYIVPDSLLHLPQHASIRRHLLQHYQLGTLMKVGEGVFDRVFRGSVVLTAVRNEQVKAEHTIQCRIVVKAERKDVVRQRQPLHVLFANGAISISQARLMCNAEFLFDLYAGDDDEPVLRTIERQRMNWQQVMTTGRGVEIAKSGMIMQCRFCSRWQNIPRKQKNGTYPPKQCVKCTRRLFYEECQRDTIIKDTPAGAHSRPIVIGEDLHRYSVDALHYLDIARGGQINYKTPALYAGEKLLVRKTGRGIYATIDRTGAYTTQVVFIFKLKPDRPPHLQRLRLSYILGALNSRMMLYYYYKIFGDIEWKSFPYMTQRTIMQLPIRAIDFTDSGQAQLHEEIADLVDAVLIDGQHSFEERDEQIEYCVRALYGVHTAEMSKKIDDELRHIRAYGPLLGSKSSPTV